MYPILIPAKAQSLRCPNKNFILLPYLARWLKKQNLLQYAIVIYDSEDMKQLAQELELKVFKEVSPNSGDINAVKECAQTLNIDIFFWLPLTSPFRSSNLLIDMQQKLLQNPKLNLVVSAENIPDRSIYYINENGTFEDGLRITRTGSKCESKIMIDGAAYLVRQSWLNTVESNKQFWSEQFDYVVNQVPFLDIDKLEDLNKFQNIESNL